MLFTITCFSVASCEPSVVRTRRNDASTGWRGNRKWRLSLRTVLRAIRGAINGLAEHATRDVKAKNRKLRKHVKELHKVELGVDHLIFPCGVRGNA